MSTFKEEIIQTLNGSKLGIPAERLDWLGISELMSRYESIFGEARMRFEKALAQVIAEFNVEGVDLGVIVDAVYFAALLAIWADEIRNAVMKIKIHKMSAEWQEKFEYVKDYYIGTYIGRLVERIQSIH